MAISKKGKRKIVVNSRSYLWWIFNEQDQTAFDGFQIKIIAEDQGLCLLYGLQQDAKDRYVSIGLRHDAGKLHLLCPQFEDDKEIITPSGINELIN